MIANCLIVFCVQSVFLQFVQTRCTHSAITAASQQTLVSPSSAPHFASFRSPEVIAPAIEATPTSGGALPVTCHSAFPEEPITVTSENAYEGTLSVNGELPFIGTVSVSGELPTAGTGAVNHACGSNVKTTKEFLSNSVAPANAIDPASQTASNLDYKRALDPRLSNLGYTHSGMRGLGMVNDLGAAAGSGNARPGITSVGKTSFGVTNVNNFAPSVGFRSAGVGNIGYGVNSVQSSAYRGVGVTNAGYGGNGEGTVAVVGELPVAGTTVVVGQLPVVGGVGFSGKVPAFGTVTISGSCSCDCNRYFYKNKVL